MVEVTCIEHTNTTSEKKEERLHIRLDQITPGTALHMLTDPKALDFGTGGKEIGFLSWWHRHTIPRDGNQKNTNYLRESLRREK